MPSLPFVRSGGPGLVPSFSISSLNSIPCPMIGQVPRAGVVNTAHCLVTHDSGSVCVSGGAGVPGALEPDSFVRSQIKGGGAGRGVICCFLFFVKSNQQNMITGFKNNKNQLIGT